MGDTASKDTTEHALGIVGGVVGNGPEISGETNEVRGTSERVARRGRT